MNFNDVFDAGPSVEPIDILRDEEKILKSLFKFFNGKVPRIRFSFADNTPPPVVPFPDRYGITLKSPQRRKFLGTIIIPQPVISPERGNTALI